jgi:hypothetical protein
MSQDPKRRQPVMSRINFETSALAAYHRAHAAEKAARDEAVLAGSLLRTIQASQTGGPSHNTPTNPMQRRSP